MTNQGDARGSSLFQAPSTVNHNHNHDHNHVHNRDHLHFHHHRRLQPPGAGTSTPHIRSPPNKKLHDRQVVIVQTVSIVHYIDATGAVTSIQTLTPDPPQSTLDLPAAASAALTALDNALPSVSLPVSIPDLTDGAPSTTSSAESSSSASTSSETLTLTPTPFTSSSAFPTLSGVFNSSSSSTRTPSLFSNHTLALFSNSTRTSSSSSRSTFASTKSRSSRLTSTTLFNVPTIAAGGTGDSAGGGAGAQAPAPTAAEPSSEPTSGLAPETRNAVVGGVVGSVAGIAIVAFVFLYLLKWRRQRGRGIMLLGDGDSTARGGRGFSSGGPAGPISGGGMAERSGAFAIPSALANLSSKRAIEAPPADPPSQEKGFYRVSGRKLVSVLESGGDGYSDPHDSMGSHSSYDRDSQGFFDSSNLPPLQLGSPMRPVSGVPIFRDGPQRTALQEESLFPPGQRRSAFPTALPIRDPVGRTFASRDGSRGSGSRFMEEDA